MVRYAGLTYLICCAGAGRLDYLTFIGRWSGIWVQDRANGHIRDTQVNQGVTSLQSRKKTSKHGSRVWWQGAQWRFTNPHCAQVQPLPHSGKVTVQEVQGTGMRSLIESNQGQSQGSQPSSAGPIWSVVGVFWSLVTVVTLATTI
jgi:hypothetical protein